MLDYKESMPVKDQLLDIANTICTRQFLVPIEKENPLTVWWANTQDFPPGIGIVAFLDKPLSQLGSRAVKSLMIAYEPEGESSITVERTAPDEIFEDDQTVLRVRDIFAKHIGPDGKGLDGRALSMREFDTRPHEYMISAEMFDAVSSEETIMELEATGTSLELPETLGLTVAQLILPSAGQSSDSGSKYCL